MNFGTRVKYIGSDQSNTEVIDGIKIGDIGVVRSFDESLPFPVEVLFENCEEVFLKEELEILND